MKKRVIMGVSIVSALVLAGIAFWAVNNMSETSPVVTQQDVSVEKVRQQIMENPETVIKQGEFTDTDLIHKGSGQAKVVVFEGSTVLKFENFKTTQGPDLFVYLSPNAPGEDLGEFVSLGQLQSNNGDQVYTLPADYEQYKTVVIWCRAFGVTFTTAELINV
jgi:hypothetical protein